MEDEESVRELARELLEMQGYTVLEARHPGEALQKPFTPETLAHKVREVLDTPRPD